MGQASVSAFVSAAQQDERLRQQYESATDLAAVVAIAAKAGFEFSEEELRSYAVGLSDEVGALSDDALGSVTGGHVDNYGTRVHVDNYGTNVLHKKLLVLVKR